MKGTTLVKDPPSFPSFELAYRKDGVEHVFEVSVGESFNQLYWEFTPEKFFQSLAGTDGLEGYFQRASLPSLVAVMRELQAGKIDPGPGEILLLCKK